MKFSQASLAQDLFNKGLAKFEALERANKDYDLVIFPNSQHGYGSFSPYMMRRRWDYFVKNLLGATPPHEYQLKSKPDPRNAVR